MLLGGSCSPISVSLSGGRAKLLSPCSLSSSVNNGRSSTVRFSKRNSVGCGVVVQASMEANNRPVMHITFEPFEEVKKELLSIPTMPHASLARQKYTDQCEAALNAQINVEYSVSYVYHAVYAYFDRDNVALKGFAKFFKESSMEERHHAEMMMEYQNKRGGRVKLQSMLMPFSEFDHAEKGDALNAMELALSLERLNNEKLLSLHSLANENNDVQLVDFIESEFLASQVEDIKKISEYVAQLRRVGKGHGVWHFDQMLLNGAAASSLSLKSSTLTFSPLSIISFGDSVKMMSKVVCVTGASGAIGSWLVHLLLDRGYTVHGTVKDLDNDAETKHLQALDGAATRLSLFQLDLLRYDTAFAAINGCSGVFHLASPCIIDGVQNPEKELLDPAIKGTLNVLKAAKEAGVQRAVVTSSIAAITPSLGWPSDVVKTENCWTDIEYCKQKGMWYSLSKTLAEKSAWDFAKENGLDVVVINPGTVSGPLISPGLNESMRLFLSLFQGCDEIFEDFYMGAVHFKDVALAHILVYENKEAAGRHLCLEAISHYGDFVAKVAELYPEYNVPKIPRDTQPGLLRAKDGAKKLMDLGLQFIPMEQIIKDAVECLKNKGFIS
ncbi:hypothetical protein RIF29_17175 [Crotalaria pallida]|uniref:ferroxidase n=1 Tax=Crotalaria pallida TaxID=3830 RepID=A0AAN9FGU0_CROPI